MGAYQAPICHLLLSGSQSEAQRRNPIKTPKIPLQLPLTSRRLLFFSLPFSSLLLLPNNRKITNKPSSSDAFAATYDPLTQAEKEASAAVSSRVSDALALLEKGRELQAIGDFNKALQYFTLVSTFFFFFFQILIDATEMGLLKYLYLLFLTYGKSIGNLSGSLLLRSLIIDICFCFAKPFLTYDSNICYWIKLRLCITCIADKD